MNQPPSPVSATGKRWSLRPADRAAAGQLAADVKLHPIVAQLLLHRGIATADAARAFVSPSLNDLHDPTTLPDIEPAAVRICRAVQRGERIVIYGDYDVDGITATSLMLKCLRLMEADAHFYLPDRLEEGYGLNEKALRAIAEAGTGLMITVDCGISAVAEVRLARELGMDVIITDHHEAAADSHELADTACAVVSAMRPDAQTPFKGLAGVGVAFKMAWQLGKCLGGGRQCTPPSASSCSMPSRWSGWAPSPTWCRWWTKTARWPSSVCAGCAPARARAFARCAAPPRWTAAR